MFKWILFGLILAALFSILPIPFLFYWRVDFSTIILFFPIAVFTASGILITYHWYITNRIYGGLKFDTIQNMFTFVNKSYKRWILSCLIFSFICLLSSIAALLYMGGNFPLVLLYYSAFVGVFTIGWNLKPPIVLFLASSRPESMDVFMSMKRHLNGKRAIALLHPEVGLGHSIEENVSIYMDNMYTVKEDEDVWQPVVCSFMDMVPVIVVDTREYSPAVAIETNQIILRYLVHKAIFITHHDGNSPILDIAVNDQTSDHFVTINKEGLIPLIKERLRGELYFEHKFSNQISKQGVTWLIRQENYGEREILQFVEPGMYMLPECMLFIPRLFAEFKRHPRLAIIHGAGHGHIFIRVCYLKEVLRGCSYEITNYQTLVRTFRKKGFTIKSVEYIRFEKEALGGIK